MTEENEATEWYAIEDLTKGMSVTVEMLKKYIADGTLEGKEVDGEMFVSARSLERFFEGE